MATKIKVTLDTDQWEFVDRTLTSIRPPGLMRRELGVERLEELWRQIRLAANGTGEGMPCECGATDE